MCQWREHQMRQLMWIELSIDGKPAQYHEVGRDGAGIARARQREVDPKDESQSLRTIGHDERDRSWGRHVERSCERVNEPCGLARSSGVETVLRRIYEGDATKLRGM